MRHGEKTGSSTHRSTCHTVLVYCCKAVATRPQQMLLGTALMCPSFLQDSALIGFIKEQLECRHSSSRCEGHMVHHHTSSTVYHRVCMLCVALCHFEEVYSVYRRLLSVLNVGQCAFLHNLKKNSSGCWVNHIGKTLFCIYMP